MGAGQEVKQPMPWTVIRERYKIIRVIETGVGYACAEAVDITEREQPMRLLNIYEGVWPPVYAQIFSRMQSCPAFCEVFVEQDSLIAVFAPCGGTEIDQVFYHGATRSWQDRLVFAEALLHLALQMSDLPPEVSCAAMVSDNVRLWPEDKRAAAYFRLRPMPDMNARELALLAADQVKKVFAPRFAQGDAEYAFYRSLTDDCFASIVPLYALWRRVESEIRVEYEAMDRYNGVKRWLVCLRKQVKRRLEKKRR